MQDWCILTGDILFLLATRSDSKLIQVLSATSDKLRVELKSFSSNNYFWYSRVRHIVTRELQLEEIEDWKRVYHCISKSEANSNTFTIEALSDPLIVQLLLDLGHNPARFNNYAIQQAVKLGYLEVVRLLLTDPRTDPSAGQNYSIKHACNSSNLEMIKLLLSDSRVDPTVGDNSLLRRAATYGNVEVIKVLLTHPRVNTDSNKNYILDLLKK